MRCVSGRSQVPTSTRSGRCGTSASACSGSFGNLRAASATAEIFGSLA